jgi:repressor LexA
MSEPLTPLEGEVYHFLIDFLAENTFQPSIREIARRFRIKSTKTVSDLLHSLEDKGYILRDESRSRGVRLIGFAAAGATQPVAYFERVGSGERALHEENRTAFITVDRRFLPGPDVYWIKARGGGMPSRGILDGDYVLVSPSTHAGAGELVVARVGDQITLKVVARQGTVATLNGSDDESPIEVSAGSAVAVLGAVCGVFRPYWEREPAPILPAGSQAPS